MKLKYLPQLVFAALQSWALAAAAQQTPAQGASPESLPAVVVSGEADNQSNTVTIGEQELDQSPGNNVRELFRDTPGVEFEKNIGGTLGSIRIRGMGGSGDGADRVAINIDGVPVADSFVYGHASNNGQSTFDMADLKMVEIKKGAARADGSRSGLAGTVNFTTKDPVDYLREGGRFGGNVRIGHDGRNDMNAGGLSLAARFSDQFSAMLSYTHRDFHETPNYKKGNDVIGSKRTAANPLDADSDNFITKLVFAPSSHNQLKLKLENFSMDSETRILNRDQAKTKDYYDRFATKRKAISLSHDFRFANFAFDEASWQIYMQKSEQDRDDDFISYSKRRGISAAHTKYEVDESGASAHLNKQIGNNNLGYGVRMRQTKVVTRLQYASPGSLRAYQTQPDTTSRNFQFYLNDDLALLDGRLHIVPGVEFTRYSIAPKATEKYYGTTKKTSQSATSWSLGASFALNHNHQLFASYRHGIKVPSFVEQNRGTISAHGSRYIPNPELKPEQSDSMEIGLRSRGRVGRQTVSLFHDTYSNFIGVKSIERGVNQVYNSPHDVTIYGLEYQGMLDLGAFGMDGLKLKAALSYTKARQDTDTGKQPYTNSDPMSGNIAIAWDAPSKQWGGQFRTHFVAAKKRGDIADGDLNPKSRWQRPIKPVAGYGFSDLTLYYKPIKNLHINAGVYNVFDKKYAIWSETIYRKYDRVTEPGRSFAINLRYDF